MGSNGSKSSGALEDEAGRHWANVLSIGDNIRVLERKDRNMNVKLPEESHTPNRIYVVINKPPEGDKGKNDPYAGMLKSIAKYGSDCKKLYEIHVDHVHNGLNIHYHPWKDGKPVKVGEGKNSPNVALPLTNGMRRLLNTVIKYVPYYEQKKK